MRALLGVEYSWLQVLPFHHLKNISCHFLLACMISAEKSVDNLMVIPLYVICCFSTVAFNIFFLCLSFLSG